ncbi:MAG: hypothetical protein ACR2OV_13920 [Hyphomicrobiaceae bacterium]
MKALAEYGDEAQVSAGGIRFEKLSLDNALSIVAVDDFRRTLSMVLDN